MSKVFITADSTCDLPIETLNKYGILLSPLYVRTGDTEHRDGVDIDANGLFEFTAREGVLPKTAACSAEDYIALWSPIVKGGDEVVHISLSSELSSCYQNACLAASEIKNVYVVDSRSLSTGSGLLAIEAAEKALEGKNGSEIADFLGEKQQKLNVSFVLDTMEYLAKGGRCSNVAAFAAGVLKLRLCIEVSDGKMDVCKKYRGKMAPVLKQYISERLKDAGDVDLKRAFITDSGVDEALRQELKQATPFEEVLFSQAGCTISSHCGPGCLGILFFTK